MAKTPTPPPKLVFKSRGSVPAAPAANEADDAADVSPASKLGWRIVAPAYLISAVVHMALLIFFGLWQIGQPPQTEKRELVATVSDRGETLEEVQQQLSPASVEQSESLVSVVAASQVSLIEPPTPTPTVLPTVDVRISDVALDSMKPSDMLISIGGGEVKNLAGVRSEVGRKATVFARGGNEASEAAVAKGLEWLAKHQMSDGSWSFAHAHTPACSGKCKDEGGLVSAKLGATALGLLPFLGAGQTHKIGKHKNVVRGGLYYLMSQMKVGPYGGELADPGGAMYSHGLAAIALCEAYTMSHDRELAAPAQAALNYIMAAQDPAGGGWRYSFQSPGDTSVVGWQLMALKSGHLGSLMVNPKTISGARMFLDSVQSEDGAKYGYDKPGAGPATTAVGLLCRMHLGWKRDEPALMKGVEYLSTLGPSPTDIYFDYYATQVLMQYDGDLWPKWNDKMRDQLIASQAKIGHETGSWFFPGGHNEAGGRLYCTSMATMTLEVYYRHMPIYKASGDAEF